MLLDTLHSKSIVKRYTTTNSISASATTFAQTIRLARLHDETALVALYQLALPVVYRYVLARLGRYDLTEDVVSEVFLSMVESISDLRSEQEAGFYAWLIQIAQGKVSKAIRRLSHKERRQVPLPDSRSGDEAPALELMATDLLSDPVALHEWRETLEEVGLALGNLSAEQQVVVIGRFLAGQKIEELAQALGKQPGAVRVLQFRALKTMAKDLGLKRGPQHQHKGGRA